MYVFLSAVCQVKEFLSIPNLLRVFIMKGYKKFLPNALAGLCGRMIEFSHVEPA